MRVFLSSVITGFEPYREAAARAIRTLQHQVIRAEDFGAQPDSPQRVCLAGVRNSDAIVLALGERYGDLQPSGLSATHEEYREARDTKPILAFIQAGVHRDPKQTAFVREVQDWAGGVHTRDFRTPEDLFDTIVGELHRFELSRAVGPLDERELLIRAENMVPERRSFREPTISFVSAAGPKQQLLRPAEIAAPDLSKRLRNEALVGDHAVFDPEEGTSIKTARGTVLITQETASVTMDALGTVVVTQPARTEVDDSSITAIVEEEVIDRLIVAMRFTSWALDEIDPAGRVTHVVPVVTVLGAGYAAWRSRAEHRRNPHSGTISMRGDEAVTVHLTPALRPRAALKQQARELAEDFVALLHHEFKE